MPLYKEWNPTLHSLAAIWHIAEPEDFFASQIKLPLPDIAHPKRRIEFLAGRFLLQYLHKDFPLHSIYKDEHDKPQLPGGSLHFSISHSFPFVACIIDAHHAVGIDIQCWHKSILQLQQKFLSQDEQAFCEHDAKKITLAWTSKEAAYKYQGLRGVDFIEHLPITFWKKNEALFDIKIKLKLTPLQQEVPITSFIFSDFALSVVSI